MSEEIKYWVTNKKDFLKNFASQVKHNGYRPLPYKKWRELTSSSTDYFFIKYIPTLFSITIFEYDTERNILYYSKAPQDQHFEPNSFDQFILTVWGYWPLSKDLALTNVQEENYHNTILTNNKESTSISMESNKLFNFDFGPVSTHVFRMSPYGLAINTAANGWVSYNPATGELLDVEILNFDVSDLIFKMPVALEQIAEGDILMHGNKPVFVRSVNDNGTVSVINYADATVVDILPVKSPFGFNFFTKICSLIDFSTVNADPTNPFGNILPFLLFGKGESKPDMKAIALFSLMNNANNNSMFNNPMMAAACVLADKQDKSLLPLILMNNKFFNQQNQPTATFKIAGIDLSENKD